MERETERLKQKSTQNLANNNCLYLPAAFFGLLGAAFAGTCGGARWFDGALAFGSLRCGTAAGDLSTLAAAAAVDAVAAAADVAGSDFRLILMFLAAAFGGGPFGSVLLSDSSIRADGI